MQPHGGLLFSLLTRYIIFEGAWGQKIIMFFFPSIFVPKGIQIHMVKRRLCKKKKISGVLFSVL